MAVVYVQEAADGQDYAKLALAVAANETDIEIRGTWSAAEAANITIDDANTTITCTGSAKHPGYVGGSPSHYRITDNSGGHVFTITATPVTLIGLDIHQTGSGNSDECIRMSSSGGTLTVKDCLIHSDRGADDQDGMHCANISCTINLENCFVYNFQRGGIVEGGYAGGGYTTTFNINSCGFYLCGEDNENMGGGISLLRQRVSTYNVNVFNTWVLACYYNQNKDYNETGSSGTANWDIHNCIASDASIADRDGAAHGCLASRAIVESDQGAGNYVVVVDTDSPWDLRLQDLGNAKNNAQDMHTDASGAGMDFTGSAATDIVGTSRPQNTSYDCGPFEIVASSSSSSESSESSSSESSESSSSESSESSSSESSESSSSESSESSSSESSESSESSSSQSVSVSPSSSSASSESVSPSSSSESVSPSSSSESSSSESSSSESSSSSISAVITIRPYGIEFTARKPDVTFSAIKPVKTFSAEKPDVKAVA